MQALMKFWLPTLTLMLSVQVQARPVVLTDLDVQSLDSERIEIRLAFDGDAPEARSYSVNDPARIAVDLDQTGSALDKRYFQIGSEKVSGVTVVEAGARTRLIVNLTEMMSFDIQSQANQLVLALGGPVVGTVKPQAPVPLTAAVDSKIQDVDFRRGDEGEGLVQINLSTASVTPDIEQQGQVVRIRFPGVELPGELARRLDVVDFGTAVQRIDAFSEEGDTVIAVRPQGAFDYLAFQTDTLFTLAVSRLTTQEQKLLEETQKYTGETLSLNFQDIEVRKVLNLIADFTNLNLVASDTVGGNITLRLQDVPWDQALDLVLRTKGLDKRQVGNVLLVAPAEEIAAREQLELENQRAAQELAPLRTEFIQVQYSKAADIAGLLTGNSISGAAEAGDSSVLLTARGSVAVDERTNTLIVQDTAAKLQEVRDLMQVLDVPVRQVMIEARIVTAESSFSERIGVRWGAFASDNLGNSGIGASIGSGFDNGALGTATQGLNVDLVPAGAQKGAFSLGLAANDVQLNLELNALEAEGRGEVVAQPKIVTADQSPASIQQGAQIPYSTVSDGGTNVQFQNAVLSLDVTPQITPDGNVIMELAIAQDSVGGTTSDGQIIIDTRKLNTTVLVGDGETIVLGGVFEETNNNDVEKVPVLGDLPLLGKLFRNKVVIEDKKELLVFITPKLINDALARR